MLSESTSVKVSWQWRSCHGIVSAAFILANFTSWSVLAMVVKWIHCVLTCLWWHQSGRVTYALKSISLHVRLYVNFVPASLVSHPLTMAHLTAGSTQSIGVLQPFLLVDNPSHLYYYVGRHVVSCGSSSQWLIFVIKSSRQWCLLFVHVSRCFVDLRGSFLHHSLGVVRHAFLSCLISDEGQCSCLFCCARVRLTSIQSTTDDNINAATDTPL